jgi:multiple sugar transport system ATP-binding protein
VTVDDIGGTPPDIGEIRGLRRFTNLVRRVANREHDRELVGAGVAAHSNGYNGKPTPGGRGSQGVFSDAGRHHRRPAELAVRLAPYPAINNGHPLAVAVRMEALHFFDDRGQRIDVGWR